MRAVRVLLAAAVLAHAAASGALQPGASGTITVRNGALDVTQSASFAWTGTHNFASGVLRLPNSTTVPTACTLGDYYFDTDAGSGARVQVCLATGNPGTWVGIDNPYGAEIDASEMAATLVFAGQELDLNTNSNNALRLPVTASNPSTNGSIVVGNTAPYDLKWYAGSAVRSLSNYAYLSGRSGGQVLYGGDSTAATTLNLYANQRADGSDDGALVLAGGNGDTTRGARITLTGNEFFSDILGGQVTISAGDDSTGSIFLTTGATLTRLAISPAGNVCLGGAQTCSATLGISGNAAASIGMENHATASSAGNTLTITSGGSGSNSNLNGGDLLLATGRATGNGAAKIDFQTVDANQGSGSSARTAATRLRLRDGHLVALGTAPTASGCGTSPTIAGTDVAGRITIGSSPGTCVITFAKAWTTNAPSCTANNQTTANLARATSVGTSSFTISGTLTASDVISWTCIGYE